jgi:thiamine-phosphate pyrophosphorylase
VRPRLEFPIVCVVTRALETSARNQDLLVRLRAAAEAGACLVHVRERALDDKSLAAFVRAVVRSVADTGAQVVVNDRADIAIAAGAAGVHLRSDSTDAAAVRSIAPDGFIVGRSVHSASEATTAESFGGCDYFVFGTVYQSTSKNADDPIAGVAALHEVCAKVRTPVLAIGGITVARVPEIARAGAAGIAAITLFADTGDVGRTVRDARAAFDTTRTLV